MRSRMPRARIAISTDEVVLAGAVGSVTIEPVYPCRLFDRTNS
jgi:hypothetical protein